MVEYPLKPWLGSPCQDPFQTHRLAPESEYLELVGFHPKHRKLLEPGANARSRQGSICASPAPLPTASGVVSSADYRLRFCLLLPLHCHQNDSTSAATSQLLRLLGVWVAKLPLPALPRERRSLENQLWERGLY